MEQNPGFDRDFVLGELISERDADELCRLAADVMGQPVAMLDERELPFGTEPAPAAGARVPLILELDPVGYLVSGGDAQTLAAVARLVRWGIISRARLRMVSDLHLEAVRADYARLQEQNDALKASEAKYRELAASLDAKVKEQIAIIDERQRQLYQAERLASIGQLAAGVAHEINNPLGFINSNLSAAQRYLAQLKELTGALPEPVRKAKDLDFLFEDFVDLLAESSKGVARIVRIVQDLKGFSNVDQPEAQLSDINAQLESLFAVIAGQKPPRVTLNKALNPLKPLLCLPGHLNQAFLNVLQNALQAAGTHGTINLSTHEGPDAVTVEIEDDGPGIPEDVMPRVFDPFFTTRGVGGGTGLGLTVARDIILAHDGTVTLANRPGGGLRVTIVLPR